MKTTVVTGATSSIGRNIVIDLLKSEQTVHAFVRDKLKANECLPVDNKNLHILHFDNVESIDSLDETFKKISKNFNIQNLICCHGSHSFKLVSHVDIEHINKLLFDNFTSTVMYVKSFSNLRNKEKNNRSIILFGSTAAIKGEAGISIYSAAKSSLISFTASVSKELARKKIRINTVSPGWVESERSKENENTLGLKRIKNIESFYPMGFGSPDDISGLVSFLITDESKWINGQNIIIDGGFSS